MHQAILHLNLNGAAAPLPWGFDFNAHGLVVLRASAVKEAGSYFRAYPVLMVLLELPCGEPEAELLGQIRELVSLRTGHNGHQPGPMLVGLCSGALEPLVREQMAEAGLDDIIARDDPDQFVAWRVRLLVALHDLKQFEQTRLDVHELAKSTRERLHDLSQPLTTVQARLQLMILKCPADDPNKPMYQELVQQTLEVTRHLAELQQLHRKYS